MKKFIISGVILLLIAASVFPVFAEERIVILSSRLWSRLAEQKFVINEVLKPFEKENNCRVIFNIIKEENQLFTQVRAELETEHVTTDVIVSYCSMMQEWVDAGYVIDLTAYVNSWTDRTFPKSLAEMTIFDDKQYFLPVGADVYLLIANKKALVYLPEGIDIQNISWKQVVDWSVAIAQGEGEGKFAVTGLPKKMLIYQYGGVILSYGEEFPIINSAGALQAWELLVKMKDAYDPPNRE